MIPYRDHDLVVRVHRVDQLDGPWAWQCSSDHCQPPGGHAASQPEALEAACQHLADAVDDHHQVASAHEGGDTLDSRAECRCGLVRTGDPHTNAAESDLDWHVHWAAEAVPPSYRKDRP
ncbi:hypothetical protein [Streptomyces vinaceus]|uniref:hypothetical protein n=1 Tax=Streptomyces vinaceus TaxID=1960 RepID=UPI0036BF6FF4